MKKIIIAIAVSLVTATSAISDITGSIGISGNAAVYAATGTEKNYDETGTTVVTTTKEYGAFSDEYASIFVEVGNEIVSLGVDYVPMKIETPQNISNDGANPNRVSADFDKLTTVYAKINIPQLGGTYLKLGYSTVDVIVNESMNSGSTYKDTDTSGMNYGIGYAHNLGMGGMSLRAELSYATFSDVSASNNATNKNTIDVTDMIGARGTISIVKSF